MQEPVVVQVPMPLTVPRSALKPIYDWRIERSLYGRETIKYGPVYAYYVDLIAFKLQASTPILVEVRGENCGVLFREISKNFTGTGNAGIRIALPSNDAYLVTLSNPSPSPASVSGGDTGGSNGPRANLLHLLHLLHRISYKDRVWTALPLEVCLARGSTCWSSHLH